MSFSASLSSKLSRLWIAGTGLATSSGNVATWTDQITGDVATASSAGSASDIALATNTFGSYPSLAVNVGSVGNSRTLLPSAPVTGTYAAFGLLLANTSLVQSNFQYNFGSFTGLVKAGQDVTIGINGIDNNNAGVTCYQDGVNVGLCLNRQSYATVQGMVFPSAKTVYELCGANNTGSSGNYFGFGGKIGAIALLNAAPTQSDINELTADLLALGSTAITPPPSRWDFFVGDSTTENYGGGTFTNGNTTYPGLVARNRGVSGSVESWQNFGWYGTTSANLLATTIPNSVVPAIAAAKAAGVAEITVNLLIGTNDLAQGTPVAASVVAGNIQSMCTAMRSAGATTIAVSTLFDRVVTGGSGQTAFNTARAALNALIVAMVPTYCDEVVRLDLDTQIGPNGSASNTTYFNADGIHLVQLGANQQQLWVSAQAFAKQPVIPAKGLVLNGTAYGYDGSWTGTGAGSGPNATTLTITSDGTTPVQNAAAWVTSDSAGLVPITGVLYSNSSGQVTFNLTTGTTYYLNATLESGGKITRVLSAVGFMA